MFVTDTHPLIWSGTGKNLHLSRNVSSVFQKAEAGETLIYIPAVVFWEVAMLEKFGKIRLSQGFERWANNLLAKSGFEIVPLEVSTISQAISYSFNNDSLDKVIVASAFELNVPLITKDVAITESNLVEVYW